MVGVGSRVLEGVSVSVVGDGVKVDSMAPTVANVVMVTAGGGSVGICPGAN